MTQIGAAQTDGARPGTIDAIPVRRPGRIVAAVIAGAIGALIIVQLIVNPAFDWAFTFEAMNQSAVIRGFIFGTLTATVGAMILGVCIIIAASMVGEGSAAPKSNKRTQPAEAHLPYPSADGLFRLNKPPRPYPSPSCSAIQSWLAGRD